MTVLAIDRERELALCAGADGAGETVEIALVGPVAAGDALLVHAGTAIAQGGGRRMKFVDEFRDAELGRALAGDPRPPSSRGATTS